MKRYEREFLENGFFEGRLDEIMVKLLDLVRKYGKSAEVENIGVVSLYM
jgi:hypothetical protein